VVVSECKIIQANKSRSCGASKPSGNVRACTSGVRRNAAFTTRFTKWSINAVDEALAGYCTEIDVVIYKDGSVSVNDNGRGIPVDIHAEEQLPAVEVAMTILHAGGKVRQGRLQGVGGLHGVGVSVVNALSSQMTTRVRRDGNLYEIKFERGITSTPFKKIGKSRANGTYQWFKTGRRDFRDARFLVEHAREAVARTRLSQSRPAHNDERRARRSRGRQAKEKIYFYEGGIVSFVEWLNENKEALTPVISTNGERDGNLVECALQWTDGYNEVGLLLCEQTSTRSKAERILSASALRSPQR